MRVAVATLVRGRRRHLERQALAVARMDPAPDDYVVVALDPAPREVPGARVLHRPVGDGEPLPLAASRNAMIDGAGADLVVCLDADCLPAPDLLRWLAPAATEAGLLAWPVGRLEQLDPADELPTASQLEAARAAAPTAGRPVPLPGEVVAEPRVERFWSLAFAVSPATHERIGGFDPGYVGYGAEDTDYAFAARVAGVGLRWVGGAWAHHQGHPVSSPPVEHLGAIVRNARRFHGKWGRWPMEGWLAAFARDGLVAWAPDGDRLELARQTTPR